MSQIQLLCEAVTICSEQASTHSHAHIHHGSGLPLSNARQPPKVSWKKVAQYIGGHGGSYQFGNATCKKKWCEIHGIKI